jgi:hypothetical protein
MRVQQAHIGCTFVETTSQADRPSRSRSINLILLYLSGWPAPAVLMLMLQWECGQQETMSALTFKHIQAGSEIYTHFQSIFALAEQ